MFVSWWKVAIAVVALTWLWAAIRYRFVSIVLADLGCLFAHLKWPLSIGVGIYMLVKGRHFLAVLSALWPLVTLILQFITPRMQIGKMQERFLNELGLSKEMEC